MAAPNYGADPAFVNRPDRCRGLCPLRSLRKRRQFAPRSRVHATKGNRGPGGFGGGARTLAPSTPRRKPSPLYFGWLSRPAYRAGWHQQHRPVASTRFSPKRQYLARFPGPGVRWSH
jgi:hypothetical protein